MNKRSAQAALLANLSTPEIPDFTGPLFSCCAHARDAAARGRFGAAHGLFQSAVLFFDCAQRRTQEQDQIQELALLSLVAARAELDDCALFVYPDVDAPQSSMRSGV